jgi:hypothetical protein
VIWVFRLPCGKEKFGYLTAEALRARRKEFLIKKYSELCDLCSSVVNTLSQ